MSQFFVRLKRRAQLPDRVRDTEAIFAAEDGTLKHMDPDGNVSNVAGAGSLPSPTDEGDVLTVVSGDWAGAAPSGGSQPLPISTIQAPAWDGSAGTDPFSGVIDAAVAANGDVYVLDRVGPDLVQQFNQDGTFVRNWESAGVDVTGIAVNQTTGDVYVTSDALVEVFEADGTPITSWDGAAIPVPFNEGSPLKGVAIDSAGNIYVADPTNTLIQVFTSAGVYIRNIDGTDGGGPGFAYPYGVDLNAADDIYVSDNDVANVVIRMTNDGTFVQSWDGSASGYPFAAGNDLEMLKVDRASGDVFVCDTGGAVVQRYTGDGDVADVLSGAETGKTKFNSNAGPVGLGVGGSPLRLYVATDVTKIRPFITP